MRGKIFHLLLLVLLIGVILSINPVTVSADDEQCCCMVIMVSLITRVEWWDCVEYERSCYPQICWAAYEGSGTGFSCLRDDLCDAPGEYGCDEQVDTTLDWTKTAEGDNCVNPCECGHIFLQEYQEERPYWCNTHDCLTDGQVDCTCP